MTSNWTALGDAADRPLQAGILEGHHAPAVAADRVMVMVPAGLDPLVAGGAAGHLEPLHEAELLELLERPVDAGPAGVVLAAAQLVVELQRGDRAIVAGERLDHRGAGAAAPQPGAPAASRARARPRRVSAAVGISADRSPRASRSASAARQRPSGDREQVGGDDRQRDRGAGGGARVVGEVEAGEAGEHRRSRLAIAIIGAIRSVSWRAAAAGPTKTATTSRLPRPWTATTIAAESRTSSAASTAAGREPEGARRGAVEAGRQQPAVQDARAARRPGRRAPRRRSGRRRLGPRMSPKSSVSIPGGESGESASSTPSAEHRRDDDARPRRRG